MSEREAVRQRIVDAAMRLLESEGREGVTTRAVSAAAGVQPPTIYRLFTDMRGLLEAVAERGFEEYLTRKRELGVTDDAVADLHSGWDLHVEFGLDYPAHYLLMYGRPEQDLNIPAVKESRGRLRRIIERAAEAGRLTVSVDTAVAMIHSACVGITLGLIAGPPAERDLDRSRRLREAVIGAVTGEAITETDELAQRAVGLKAALGRAAGVLSAGERALLDELLDRLAENRPRD